MTTPLPQPLGTDSPLSDAELLAGEARRSTLALVAFVVGLVFLLPWAPLLAQGTGGVQSVPPATWAATGASLAAFILGIVAVVRTGRKRQRGRGMAIAAIPAGLLGAGLNFVFGFTTYTMVLVYTHSQAAVKVLSVSEPTIDEKSSSWYAEMASERFQTKLPLEDFKAWLTDAVDKHGQLQKAELDKRTVPTREGGAIRVRYTGRFVNGGASIDVWVGFDDGKPKVVDLQVDGRSPLKR